MSTPTLIGVWQTQAQYQTRPALTLDARYPRRAYLLTLTEVGELLNLDPRAVMKLCVRGELRSLLTEKGSGAARPGWRWVWRYDVERYRESKRQMRVAS